MVRRPSYRSPWESGWREEAWNRLKEPWDLIVIGGGITGAGILAIAVRCGIRALLLEMNDFSSGTSSRSSKMVHGGLRYLKHMQIKLTRESVRERQRLLEEAPGLVEPLGFIYPIYEGERPSPWVVGVGLGIYTHLAPDTGDYQRLDEVDIGMMAPGLKTRSMERAYHYLDAQTDDACLVERVLHDALAAYGKRAAAINYAAVVGLVKKGGRVVGVAVKDEASGHTEEAGSRVVINATGVWADELRGEIGKVSRGRRLRPLRGSHLYFGLDRFPVYQAIAFSHPDDGRPVFVYPWEGVALVGTTDVDHDLPLGSEPSISVQEADYLLRAVQSHFPGLELGKEDVLSTQAGIRPVVDTGKADPSAESRDHVIWPEHGLLTVTGGKLTTFRLVALDALKGAHELAAQIPEPDSDEPVIAGQIPNQGIAGVDPAIRRRLWGRYGVAAPDVVAAFPNLLTPIPHTPYLWAELAWSCGHEPIFHLDDLMLRRFRLGILLPDGGFEHMSKIRAFLKKSLGWSEARWNKEVSRYRQIWTAAHGLPAGWRRSTLGQR
jgi:glycerol-3-phosphate dehydrogenase